MQSSLKIFSKYLRRNETPQEKRLWSILRNNNLGYKFRRQAQIDEYIVDFCCFEKRFIIEIDGGQHNETKNVEKDKIRDNYLKTQSFRVLRIWNNEIDANISGVFDKITEYLK